MTSHACHLYGFPGYQPQAAGHQVGSAAQRDNTVAAPTVTLAAGATAHARLTITDVSALPGSCRPVTADGLARVPARRLHRRRRPLPVPGLLGHRPAFLSVRVVQPRVGVPGH